MTDHIDVAHQAILTIPGTSVGADTLARFLKEHPQIDTPGGAPRYLVMGSLAVAALTGNQRCWEDCTEISLVHTGRDQAELSTSLTKSRREKGFSVIRMYELNEPNVKLRSSAHVQCAPVVDSNNTTLSLVLVPHPAVLTVLTAADVFEARDDVRGARDCEALLGLLERVAEKDLELADDAERKLPANVHEWRTLIRHTYEGLQGDNRRCAHDALERAVEGLVNRTGNQKFRELIPPLGEGRRP